MDALGADDPNDTPAMAAVCDAYRATRTTDTTFGAIKPSGAKHNSTGRPAGHGGVGG